LEHILGKLVRLKHLVENDIRHNRFSRKGLYRIAV
jgi:hypothetical protein